MIAMLKIISMRMKPGSRRGLCLRIQSFLNNESFIVVMVAQMVGQYVAPLINAFLPGEDLFMEYLLRPSLKKVIIIYTHNNL